jgi:MerR family transcriptional regulator/heat shock protein HspR
METTIDIYEAVLTIGTVAEKLDVSVQTLRLYEQHGLILPFKTQSGRRMYSMHDLERLRCIRKMITENGINLNGIKRLMALIPCWEYKGGLDEECKQCPVYYESIGPCWSVKNVGPKCQNVSCRDCPVYCIEINCNKLKEVIYGHTPPNVDKIKG